MTEADLLKVRSFGRTSLREVKRKLADLGLSLGMTFSETGAVLSSEPNTGLDEDDLEETGTPEAEAEAARPNLG
jgi:hypothetical protein